MADSLELVLSELLKKVVREVVVELRAELNATTSHRPPETTIANSVERLLTPREAAKRLTISARHLFRLTQIGEIPCVRIGKCVRYRAETLQQWILDTESTQQPDAEEATSARVPEPPKRKPTSVLQQKTKPKKPPQEPKPATETVPSPNSNARKTPQPAASSANPPLAKERLSPFRILMRELGVDDRDLPPITNGDLRRIAGVDIATMHGWLYLNTALPEEALTRLKDHCRSFAKTHAAD